MAFTNNYDTSTPDGDTQTIPVLDDEIRDLKKAIQERLDGADIFWPLTGTQVSDTNAGKHRKVTFRGVLSTKPTLLSGETALYIKTVSGSSELFYENSAGLEIQLTSGGSLIIANNTFLLSINQAGTGTVSLIKANTSDKPVLPDGAEMATDAAPTTNVQIANRKYVNDMMTPVATGPRAGYAGEESVTLPNGFIMKMGKTSTPTGDHTSGQGTVVVTFGTAFPNSIISIQATVRDTSSAGPGLALAVKAASTSAITISWRESIAVVEVLDGIYWTAMGY